VKLILRSGKIITAPTMQAGSGGLTHLILNRDTRWRRDLSFTPLPPCEPAKKDRQTDRRNHVLLYAVWKWNNEINLGSECLKQKCRCYPSAYLRRWEESWYGCQVSRWRLDVRLWSELAGLPECCAGLWTRRMMSEHILDKHKWQSHKCAQLRTGVTGKAKSAGRLYVARTYQPHTLVCRLLLVRGTCLPTSYFGLSPITWLCNGTGLSAWQNCCFLSGMSSVQSLVWLAEHFGSFHEVFLTHWPKGFVYTLYSGGAWFNP